MSDNAFERCVAFINCQLTPSERARGQFKNEACRMAVTISRQTGSGAMAIAQRLADYLQEHCPGKCEWAVFDRNLMDKVLEDHHLPKRLSKFLPEDSISGIDDMVEELFGLHPPSWTVVRQCTETILHLAGLGNVILIGRGANVITRNMDNVVHVRLVGSVEKRVERLQKNNNLSRAKALEFIRLSDRGRARYLKKYFDATAEDPLLYDLVLNTDKFSEEEAARLIGEIVFSRAQVANASRMTETKPE